MTNYGNHMMPKPISWLTGLCLSLSVFTARDRFEYHPYNTGIKGPTSLHGTFFINSIFSSDFWTSEPDRISLYYEISTCDLYVRQKIMSHNIPLRDIFCFAVGLQYTIMWSR